MDTPDVRATAYGEESPLCVLDLLALGVVLLDPEGEVVFANQAARQLTADRDGVVVGTRVQAANRQAGDRLREILGEVAAASEAGIECLNGMALPRPSGGRDMLLLASAMPMPAVPRVEDPQVVLFLSDPERRLELSEEVVASLFGLTSAESRIAIALAEGRRRDQIAKEFEVSRTTVAFHLRNLFQKTATHRQTDLIALILVGLMAISPEVSFS